MTVASIWVPTPNKALPPAVPVVGTSVGPTGPTGMATGLSVTVTTAKITPSGSTGTMVFTAGVLTGQTQAT